MLATAGGTLRCPLQIAATVRGYGRTASGRWCGGVVAASGGIMRARSGCGTRGAEAELLGSGIRPVAAAGTDLAFGSPRLRFGSPGWLARTQFGGRRRRPTLRGADLAVQVCSDEICNERAWVLSSFVRSAQPKQLCELLPAWIRMLGTGAFKA